jgi:hypothetical protein
MLALVLLVVALVLSQTDDGSKTNEGGMVDNVLGLLGASDGSEIGEDEAVALDTDAGVDVDAGGCRRRCRGGRGRRGRRRR